MNFLSVRITKSKRKMDDTWITEKLTWKIKRK